MSRPWDSAALLQSIKPFLHEVREKKYYFWIYRYLFTKKIKVSSTLLICVRINWHASGFDISGWWLTKCICVLIKASHEVPDFLHNVHNGFWRTFIIEHLTINLRVSEMSLMPKRANKMALIMTNKRHHTQMWPCHPELHFWRQRTHLLWPGDHQEDSSSPLSEIIYLGQ